MSQLTTVDATFLNAETSTTHAHIAGLAIVDASLCPEGRLTAAAVTDLIRERAHLAALPLRRRLARVPLGLDHPYWEDDPGFDPRRHVFEIGLPAPGGPGELADACAMLHERPLDRARPLWEIAVIQGLADGMTGVYIKSHHAAIDGVTAAEALAALLDLSPEPREVPVDNAEPERAPSPAGMLRAGLLKAALFPVQTALSAVRTAPYLDEIPGVSQVPGIGAVSRMMQEALGLDEMPRAPRTVAPPTPFNRPIGPRRSFAYGELDLDEIKQIRRTLGGSVNDIMMALCATALRQWLDKRGALPDGPLVVGVPVSLRKPGHGSKDGDMEGEAGNRLSIMTTPLAVHVADPAERYIAVRRDLELGKRRFATAGSNWVQELTGMLPAPLAGPVWRLAQQALPALSVRPMNLMISNVPGPQFPLYLCGARLHGYYPASVVTDVSGGINITVFSYDGKVDVGVIACRDLVPTPSEFIDHLTDALDELKALARERAS